MVPAGRGGLETRSWDSAALGRAGAPDRALGIPGWGLAWKERLDIRKITEGGQGGLRVGGPLMEKGLARPPLRSGLWRCGTSGRAHGHPEGSSRCHPPQWTVASHSPGRKEEEPAGGRPLCPPTAPPPLKQEDQMPHGLADVQCHSLPVSPTTPTPTPRLTAIADCQSCPLGLSHPRWAAWVELVPKHPPNKGRGTSPTCLSSLLCLL